MDNLQNNVTDAEEKPVYSVCETVFAWLCFLFGYLFCRLFPGVGAHLGGFLYIIVLFAVTAAVMFIKKIKPEKNALISAVLAAVAGFVSAVSMLTGGDVTVEFFAYCLALALYMYFVSASFGGTLEKGFSSLIAADFLRALFVLPFVSFAEIFRGVSGGKDGKKSFISAVGKALLGIAVAVIPTLIIVDMLEYDSDFSTLFNGIVNFDFSAIGSHIVSIVFGIPVAMYIFGGYASARERRGEKTGASAEKQHEKAKKAQIASGITAVFATLPVLFVYAVFFVSQWKYFVSGFRGALPEGIGYADYARNGFFELCTVSFINLVIIAALSLFLRRRENGKSVILNVLTLIFSLSSLVLIATAASKMIMYVKYYGTTPSRVHASWFICLLAVLFVLIPVLRFTASKKIIPLTVTVSVAAFLIIAVIPVNPIIADTNVDRYINGSLPKVDVDFLTSLDDAAIPAMCRLEKYWSENPDRIPYDEVHYSPLITVRQRLTQRKCRDDGNGLFDFSLVKLRAEQALAEYNG